MLAVLCIVLSVAGQTRAEADSLQNFKTHRGDGQYNRAVPYIDKKQISFPDFSLLPMGSRYVPMQVQEATSECCHFHDFRLQKGNYSKTITWSEMNLSKNNPLVFRFGRQAFVFYMQEVGDRELDENEIVILKIPR